jgi:hypothetical protein
MRRNITNFLGGMSLGAVLAMLLLGWLVFGTVWFCFDCGAGRPYRVVTIQPTNNEVETDIAGTQTATYEMQTKAP